MLFIIPGDPIPLARVRFNKQTNTIYDCQKSSKTRSMIYIQNQLDKKHEMHTNEKPLKLDITFFMPIPLSSTKKSREGYTNKYHRLRPDLSNMIKFIEDVCNDLIYKDDAMIAEINAVKLYSSNPRTEFTITILEDRKKE